MKSLDPVLAAIVALLLLILAAAGGIYWVMGRDPAKIYRPAGPTVGAVSVPTVEEEEAERPAAPVDDRPVDERYAELFAKNFFARPGAVVAQRGPVLPGEGNPIPTEGFRLLGVVILEGGPAYASIDDGTGARARRLGDTLAVPGGEPPRILEIRPDGVVLTQPGFDETLLPLRTSLEGLNQRRGWFNVEERRQLNIR